MERVWSTLHRGFSVQSILTFVLTVFIAALLWVTFGSDTSTHALDTTTASWKGASILYNGHQYFSAGDAKAGDSVGLAVGTHYYLYTADNNGAVLKTQKAFVIYFTPGTDPPTATAATFTTYDYSSSKMFSNPTGALDIIMTPRGTESTYSSCSVEGIGYFICPVTVFLADTMDNLFNLIKNFFVVAPVNTTNTTNDLYTAWNVIRSIANLAFIIVFLIIIYSQLTSAGISNYGLKKLLPRLIIAAILVNLSYFICAAAIDISNILGYSLQDLFASIRQNTFKISNDAWTNSATITWGAITTLVLSGGAASIGLIALAGEVGAGLYLLIPVLLGLVATVLVVLLILAARQAIIVILVVIAPLAFVAYLLPNTEQWFKKWRDLFMTMLVFFPAFSLVFGGSQLAGGIIVQNATTIVAVIFGLAVQVAPLAITPLLLKLSGNLLGRIGGMVNNPKKGLMDRTKAWSKDRSEMHRQKSLRETNGRRNPFRSTAQFLNNNNRNVKERTEQYQLENDNRYHGSKAYSKIHSDTKQAELAKERIGNANNSHTQRLINSTGSDLHLENIRLEASKIELGEETKITDADVIEYRAGRRVATGELNTLMTDMKQRLTSTAAETQRAQAAQYIEQKNISTEFTAETVAGRALLSRAGGIDPSGVIRAEANARGALIKLEKEALDSSVQLLNARAIGKGTTLKNYAMDISKSVRDGTSSEPAALIEAAIEAVALDGQVSIMRQLRMSSNVDQSIVTRVLARNAVIMKEKGAFDLQANPNLAGVTQEVMNASIAETIGEISASNLSGIKAGFWADIANTSGDPNNHSTINEIITAADRIGSASQKAGIRSTYITLTEALRNDNIRATLGDRLNETMLIHEALQNKFREADKEIDYSKYR